MDFHGLNSIIATPSLLDTVADTQIIPLDLIRAMFALILLSYTSVLATGGIIVLIIYRIPNGILRTQRRSSMHSATLLIIFQILLADFIQSLGFFMSVHWLADMAIYGDDPLCSIQGFTINLGDMASAFFVLFMAVQTYFHLVRERTIPQIWVYVTIIFVWAISLILSSLGPVLRKGYFEPTGAWVSHILFYTYFLCSSVTM